MKIKSLKFRKRVLALVSLKIIYTLGYLKFHLTEITEKVAPSGAAFVSLASSVLFKMPQGLPWQSRGQDPALPMQGLWV